MDYSLHWVVEWVNVGQCSIYIYILATEYVEDLIQTVERPTIFTYPITDEHNSYISAIKLAMNFTHFQLGGPSLILESYTLSALPTLDVSHISPTGPKWPKCLSCRPPRSLPGRPSLNVSADRPGRAEARETSNAVAAACEPKPGTGSSERQTKQTNIQTKQRHCLHHNLPKTNMNRE